MGIRSGLLKLLGVPTKTFSSGPRPIDQMFLEMRGLGSVPSVGREEALSVPAVQRGRNLICNISTLPLVQYGPDRTVVPNALLEQLDSDVPNVVTLAQTVEDLLFDGISWWRITAFGWDGFPVKVRRIDPGSVSLNPPAGRSLAPLPSGLDPRDAVLWVDGVPVPASQMIRFDSPNPGILRVGGRAIRRAILLDQLGAMYADDPRPLDYFSPVEGADPADDAAVLALLDDWKAARKRRSTAYVPASLAYHTVAAPSPAELQLAELQKQAGLEIANMLGIDPEELGISTTSRTYANDVDRRKNKVNDTLSPYMLAISERLSMGDVTRRGYVVRFDLDDYLRADPMTRATVYEKYLTMGVLSVEQIAAEENLPTPVPAPEPAEQVEEPTEEAADQVEESTEPAMTFSESAQFVDLPLETFAVDTETRTITGLALPYGRTGKGFRFEKGALRFSDPTRIKLLRDHDPKQAIGHAVELTDTNSGFKAKFKVARGAEGDAALQLAEDGVLDGLSVGVDFDHAADTVPDPRHRGGTLIRRADLREVSLTAMPAFDDARVTRVAASLTGGSEVTDTIEPTTAPEPTPAIVPVAETFERQVVNPVRPTGTAFVREALPYRFDRGGNFRAAQHEFSTDVVSMLKARDIEGIGTEAGKRVMGLLSATFDIDSADINELNPNIQRPDMYVDQRDYKTPLWNFVNKGAPPNGVTPFTVPKYSSSSGLVGDHTEGTEPSSGTFVTTSQTITPTGLSGKASITREVFDMGGNPAVSTLIFNQMVRGYREGLESATATFLNTLTAATDITLTTAATNEALAADWDAALAGLQFIRGYDFEAFAMEAVLYKAFVAARDDVGRVLYPISAPQNVNGTAQTRFRTLDLGGVTGVPSWALPSTPGSPNNSWLFDPSVVQGWATAPQRLEFAGTDASGGYAPVAMVDIAIWGYKAFANTDIGGVRQVIYDSVS